MYNKDVALALAEAVAQRVQKQREEQLAARQEAAGGGAWSEIFGQPGDGNGQPQQISPFAEMHRTGSRVQFSL